MIMRKRWGYVEVKIVKPSAYECWYDKFVGKTFTAYKQMGDFFYIIHEDNSEDFTHLLYKEDCEIVRGDINELYPGLQRRLTYE